MKNLIATLLKKEVTKTKKSIDELGKYCYLVHQIAELDEQSGTIRKNSNEFWSAENNNNRIRLMNDIKSSSSGIRGMYGIYNEYENGNGYGIVRQ